MSCIKQLRNNDSTIRDLSVDLHAKHVNGEYIPVGITITSVNTEVYKCSGYLTNINIGEIEFKDIFWNIHQKHFVSSNNRASGTVSFRNNNNNDINLVIRCKMRERQSVQNKPSSKNVSLSLFYKCKRLA